MREGGREGGSDGGREGVSPHRNFTLLFRFDSLHDMQDVHKLMM